MFKQNLNQILSSFSKTISQLENLQKRHSAAVEKHNAEIALRSTAKAALEVESAAAARVAEKIRGIIQ